MRELHGVFKAFLRIQPPIFREMIERLKSRIPYTDAHVFVLRIRVLCAFQCVVRTNDLKCVENANQLVSTQGKIMNIHMRWEALVS